MLWVFRVVYFEVEPQGAQLLEALVALAAVEALLLCVHLNNPTMKSSPLDIWSLTHLLLVLGQTTLVGEGLVAVETGQQVVFRVASEGFDMEEGFWAELAGEKVPRR